MKEKLKREKRWLGISFEEGKRIGWGGKKSG